MRAATVLLARAALLIVPCLVLGEIPEPFPKWDLQPVEVAYPAFARRDPASFTVDADIKANASAAWDIMREQGSLIKHMVHCKEIFNFTGAPGDWLMVVQWHTPNRWHRWTRTDVRKYTTLDNKARSISYFLVGGFGLWMPRLAFRETVLEGASAQSSKLHVEVWYELDDSKIGWPTDNLKELTKERWTLFYSSPEYGYASAVSDLAQSLTRPHNGIGVGRIQDPLELKKYEL